MIFEKMCHAAAPIINEIHKQKFNLELSQGILPKEKFIHYLIQDSLYLSEFSKALALTAVRLSDNDQAQQFLQFAIDSIKTEHNLHDKYMKENNQIKILTKEQSPVCFMYTNYLLKTASLASVEEAVASLLPCFWVYWEVGKNISIKKKINNPYNEWIALYSSNQFDLSVNLAINTTNSLGNSASDFIKEKMISAFVRSTQLEWLFWESAYYQEQWLIGNNKNSICANF